MRIVLSISLVLLMFCCQKTDLQTQITVPIVEVSFPTGNQQYLALGDSYTIGQGVLSSGSYPIQLQNRLEAENCTIETTIIAQTGWRTDHLIAAIDAAALTDTFDLVSLLIGVNNQYQNKPIATYEIEFLALLNTAISLAGNTKENVFVISIPDYGYTPFGVSNQASISAEIDQYNAINKRISDSIGVSWFDITPISRLGLARPELVADDDLHPSEIMYGEWVDSFFGAVKGKLD